MPMTPPVARPHPCAPDTTPRPTCASPCAGCALGEPKRKKPQPPPGCAPPRAVPAAFPSSRPSLTGWFPQGRTQPDIWPQHPVAHSQRGPTRMGRLNTAEGWDLALSPQKVELGPTGEGLSAFLPGGIGPIKSLEQGLGRAEHSAQGHGHERVL